MDVPKGHGFSFVSLAALLGIACAGKSVDDRASAAPTSASTTTSASTMTNGSATTSGLSETSGPAYCDPTPILVRSCAGAVCHGQPGRPAAFNTDLLNAPAGQSLGQSLIGKPANYDLVVDATACPTNNPELLIHPSIPAESLILKKLFGTQACGLAMPNTTAASAMLTEGDKACFVDWVNGVITESGGTVSSDVSVTAATAATTTTSPVGTITGAVTTAGSVTITTTGGGTTGGAEIAATFETAVIVFTTNQPTCTSADCHGGHPGAIDLRPDEELYERLTTTSSEVCGNLIVNPGSPDQSALVQVLTTGCGNVAPQCSIGTECIPRMPLECTEGFDCIPPNYIEALRQWIANGAPPE